MALEQDSLEYHRQPKPGKVEVVPSKACDTDRDLSLAYSPGVAFPCIHIAREQGKVFDYTSRGNLVAVISNGTAVLGLGDIGPFAAKPVMEGKGVLFKKFANIDVFDIELDCKDPQQFIETVKRLEPTFGGINLEDIKAPECFVIEEALRREMKIPVFHDDQHGTAIITGAALINAVAIAGKKLDQVRIVMNGAGASSIACAKLFLSLGVKLENILMCDSQGVIYKGRTSGMNQYKSEFANATKARTLADAFEGADVFVGLSAAGAVTKDMVARMASKPIIFAMANPVPEIMPEDAKEIRPDALMATGRSDYPNQVNNVLGFPFIFRGALDVRATSINEAMKLAAVHAIANLAREEVPESVSRAYGGRTFKFGPEYMIPKPFDPRVLLSVAPAVAKAAVESGVAQRPITDFQAYRDQLESMFGPSKTFIRNAINRVKSRVRSHPEEKPRLVFPEATSEKVLRAAQVIAEEGIAEPILLGYPEVIESHIQNLELDQLFKAKIIHASQSAHFERYSQALFEMRKRKGVQLQEARRLMADPNYFGAMMVNLDEADAMVNGVTQNYADSVRPILEIIGTPKKGIAAGISVVLAKDRVLFFTDTTVNIEPTAEEVATIAIQASEVARFFQMDPSIAMLSFSNFVGKHPSPRKMRMAAEMVKSLRPDLKVDGEMQADTAVNKQVIKDFFAFCELPKGANILVFPSLDASNIAYKLLQQLGEIEVLGPFLMGIRRPAHVLQRAATVNDIVNTAALAALHVHAVRELRAQKRG